MVELVFEPVPVCPVLALSAMTLLQRKGFDLLGLKLRKAPSLGPPSRRLPGRRGA